MKRSNGAAADRCSGKVVAALAAVVLLFPSSASVLCITPGGHVAIEDLNATCCASSAVSVLSGHQPDSGLNAAGDCKNCTDLFMTPNGRGAILVPTDAAAASPLSDECPGHRLPVDLSLWLCDSGAIIDFPEPIPVFSSVPLRC